MSITTTSLAASGSFVPLGAAFLAGLGTVLTPCIYPLIPVTLSLFGVTANLSRLKAFLLSSSYVAGMCATYTVLGIFSAKTGALFGSFLGNPYVVSVLALFLTILALSSLEIIELRVFSKLQNSASRVGGLGYGGAFVAGAVSGFVAAPCAGPILLGVLAIAAQSQSTAWGALLLFTYALGLGSVFIVLGTFSNLVATLPRPGNWMGMVKLISAAGLLGVVLFVLQPFLPAIFEFTARLHNEALLVGLIVVSIFLALFSVKKDLKFVKLLAAFLLALSCFQLFIVGPPNTDRHSGWLPSLDVALKDATEKQGIVMVDLYADWCGACKELDEKTFSAPVVKERLDKLTKARLNFSIVGEEQQALLDKYDIPGLPAVIFLNADGTEIPDTRVAEFITPEQFLPILDKATK